MTADAAALPRPADLPRLRTEPARDDDPAMPRRAVVEQVMGLPVSLHVRGPGAHGDAVAAALAAAYERLRADDATFSPYRPDSVVSRVRDGRARLAGCGPRVRLVASLCDEARERTDGAFDAVRPDPVTGRRWWDPTGLVKGWAVQDAVRGLREELERLGRRHGGYDLLAVAGGDVAVACARTDTPDWVVGVEDPADRARLLATVRLRTGAVATSGTAARGAHVHDPRTGVAATRLASATVVGPSLLWADVDATALLVDGRPDPAPLPGWFRRQVDSTALLRAA
ncbi:FAD:protein FMN transferase [Lapillicoccus jejuensis]|uniref:FAD:protein FMN transferase n=1 Tax=Lapillicoccus jejuensis TaxID=402171 RepID=A0A542E0N9_9MICO|nr:FAD:protein FMN transferase [Lapillicoccus jejuensis]TQJ08907.1 thiamine biosynthesis lipoprotein [Lapillicoccus jejuensis]